MLKGKMIKTGLLGIAGMLAVQAHGDEASDRALSILNLTGTDVNDFVLADLTGSCYGLPCPGSEAELNCSDSVIAHNLNKLRDLNIVEVESLAAFQCTGYCFTNNPTGRLADKCDKANALAKLVELVKPLAVSVKY